MKLNLLKTFFFFFILLIVGAIVFIVTPDFASTKGLPTFGIPEIVDQIAETDERISEPARILFYTASVLLGLLRVFLPVLNWAAGIGMYFGPGSLGHIFIEIGYTWLLGMVNMFFVIAFVFAALLYILDVEWGIVDKKTLPRLIIVAFLINFSLLFVQLIIDFFIIFERGVAEQLMPGGLTPMLETIEEQATFNWLVFILIPYLILFTKEALATISSFLLFGIPSLLLSIVQAIALPTLIISSIVEIISNIFLLIVFFLYTVLFIARSVVIYVFAMLAPLAIAATIFPQTRKYFDEWLKQLLLWGAMGTIIFFVLGFGFHMHGLIMGGILEIGIEGVEHRLSLSFIANFLFAIYALISLFMIKRFLPSAAQGAIGMLQKGAMLAGVGAAGMVGGAALMKYGGGVQKTLSSWSEKVGGTDTIFGRELAKGARNIGERRKKEIEGRAELLDDKSEDERTESTKTAKTDIDKEVLIKSMQRRGQKIKDEHIINMGFKDEEGKADFTKFAKFIGSDFEKEDYYERCRYSKKIQDGANKIEKLRREGATDKEIKDQEDKNQSDIRKIGLNASSKDLEKIIEGNPDLRKNKVFVDAVNERKDIQATFAICQNDEKILKELVKEKIGACEGNMDLLMKSVEDYRPLFEIAATLPNEKFSSAIIRKIFDGSASIDEKEKLYVQLEEIVGNRAIAIDKVAEQVIKRKEVEEKQKEKQKKERIEEEIEVRTAVEAKIEAERKAKKKE